MPKTFHLKILTPNNIVLDEDIEELIAKTIDGEVGILPGHAPLITPLDQAPLKYKSQGDMKIAAVLGGMMEVSSNCVTIISDHAALAEDIDSVKVEREKELAQAKLSQKKEKVDVQKAEMELHKLLVMLNAVELAKLIRK